MALSTSHKWYLGKDWLDKTPDKCFEFVGFHVETPAMH